MQYWSVPPLWARQTVAILASGPSMSQAVADQVRDVGIPAIAINTTFRLAPWATMLYAADPEWWQHPAHRGAHDFAGLKVSCSNVKGVLLLRNTGKEGFDPDQSAIRTGGNSAYQALHIAIHAGAARILLCGLDMHGGRHHWHGEHPHGLKQTVEENYAEWIKRFNALIKPLAERGIEVLNCTPGSALRCFPMADLAEALKPMQKPTLVGAYVGYPTIGPPLGGFASECRGEIALGPLLTKGGD